MRTSKGLWKVKGSEKFCNSASSLGATVGRKGQVTGADRFTVITVVDHILSRHIQILSVKKGKSMPKNLVYPFVTLAVTHLKVEDTFEHKTLPTLKRQARRNETLFVAKSPIYSQMLQEVFFVFSFPG